jgi:hypothetical protein
MRKTRISEVWVTFVLAPAAIGAVTGWLVGASRSPVVATVVPLVFGLLGGIGFGAVGKLFASASIVQRILSSPTVQSLDEHVRNAIKSEAIDREGSRPVAAFLSTGVIAFCVFFYAGAQFGIASRVPAYNPLLRAFSNTPLRSYEAAALHKLRLVLQANGVAKDHYDAILSDVFLPIFIKYPEVGNTPGSGPPPAPNGKSDTATAGADQNTRTDHSPRVKDDRYHDFMDAIRKIYSADKLGIESNVDSPIIPAPRA